MDRMTARSPLAMVCLTFALAALPSAAFAQGQVQPARTQEPVRRADAGSVDLRPKFRVGVDRRIILRQETSQTLPDDADAAPAKPGSVGQRVTSTNEVTLVFRPTAVTPQGATVEITIDAIRASRRGGDVNDSFDSSKPAPKKQSKPAGPQSAPDPGEDLIDQLMKAQSLESRMRPLVGEKLTMRTGPDGDVLEVRGGDKLAEALSPMGGGLGALTSLPATDGSAATGTDLFKSIVGGPGKPRANVGDTWETATDLSLSILGQFRMTTRSTLASLRGPLAQIDMRGTMEPSSEAPAPGTGGPKVDVSYSGSCQWDVEDGFVKSMNTRQMTSIRLNNTTKPLTTTAETTTTITRSGATITPRR